MIDTSLDYSGYEDYRTDSEDFEVYDENYKD